MPTYTIRVINSEFTADDEHDLGDLSTAKMQALKGALEIASEEVLKGLPFFGAEVRVERGGDQVARFLVSVGTSPLS